jgi:hypothetical protein
MNDVCKVSPRRADTPEATDQVNGFLPPLNTRINAMNTLTVGLSRFTAAACATLITAAGAWAFVSSSASTERDPFQFAAVMAANAQAHSAQLQSRNTTPACHSESAQPACVTLADNKASEAP